VKILETAAQAAMLAATLFAVAVPAQAQTLNMAKALDSPHYDSQRTTW